MTGTITILAAIAQQVRLDVLTLLAKGPSEGQTSGDLATQLGVQPSSMSTHLGVLAAAGLVSARKVGRRVIYFIERDMIGETLGALAARFADGAAPSPTYYSSTRITAAAGPTATATANDRFPPEFPRPPAAARPWGPSLGILQPPIVRNLR